MPLQSPVKCKDIYSTATKLGFLDKGRMYVCVQTYQNQDKRSESRVHCDRLMTSVHSAHARVCTARTAFFIYGAARCGARRRAAFITQKSVLRAIIA